MAEIKPCPFCGSIATGYGKNLNEKELQAKRIWNLYCVQCGAGTDYFETTKEAIEAWNRRMTMAEWISVKDHKPKEFISVLGHMTDAGEFPSVRECYRGGEAFFFPALKDIHPVDKWMEMPEPPKGE